MSSRVVFSILKISTSILFYLLVLFSVIFLTFSVIRIVGIDTGKPNRLNSGPTYEVLAFGTGKKEQSFTYSRDSVVRYESFKDHYTIQVEPQSSMGYYGLVMKMIFLGIGIAILWNFKKIFSGTKLDDPFRRNIIKRLKILAALFIISDLLKLVDYFIFNSFLHHSITSPRFQLLTTLGDRLITGLIILVIAVIYQRGVALQEENALTV